jgi:23S rRNA (cytidine1920-2'-O)/16S rRNA (cytidine1409-2'-O)-methyltransferase
MERLDVFLVNNGYFQSREKANQAIKKGLIEVDGKVINKPAFNVNTENKIVVLDVMLKYVSWGGMKLERAINYFNLDFKDKVVLDIGASTGGFTDCALQHGAKCVYAVDVGSNQLDLKLRADFRVHSYENTNICDFDVDVKFDYLVMDVSFASITKIIPSLLKFMDNETKLLCLFKPQFEVGKIRMKNGVIKDPKIHKDVCVTLVNFIKEMGLYVNDLTYSTQKGKSGNIEYLALVSRDNNCKKYSIDNIISESHKM